MIKLIEKNYKISYKLKLNLNVGTMRDWENTHFLINGNLIIKNRYWQRRTHIVFRRSCDW